MNGLIVVLTFTMYIPKLHFHKNSFCFTPSRESKGILKQLNEKMEHTLLIKYILYNLISLSCWRVPADCRESTYIPACKFEQSIRLFPIFTLVRKASLPLISLKITIPGCGEFKSRLPITGFGYAVISLMFCSSVEDRIKSRHSLKYVHPL